MDLVPPPNPPAQNNHSVLQLFATSPTEVALSYDPVVGSWVTLGGVAPCIFTTTLPTVLWGIQNESGVDSTPLILGEPLHP